MEIVGSGMLTLGLGLGFRTSKKNRDRLQAAAFRKTGLLFRTLIQGTIGLFL